MQGLLGALKPIRVIAPAVLALIGLTIGGAYVVSEQAVNTRVDVSNTSVSVPTDIAAVQHGQHMAGAIALCTRCHGADLTGSVVVDDAAAHVVAPNITRGGTAAAFSDADYARAIRDGVAPDGRRLWLMPTDAYSRLSDTDLGSLIAYLKALPPVTRSLPPNELRPLGRLQLATGQSALIAAAIPDAAASAREVSADYGDYLVTIAGCSRCHGPGLSGGAIPGAPRGSLPATNLTPSGLGDWSEADFLRAMRSGRRPDGRAIDAAMPWPYYAQMSDLELRAIWAFLGVVPPRPSGTR